MTKEIREYKDVTEIMRLNAVRTEIQDARAAQLERMSSFKGVDVSVRAGVAASDWDKNLRKVNILIHDPLLRGQVVSVIAETFKRSAICRALAAIGMEQSGAVWSDEDAWDMVVSGIGEGMAHPGEDSRYIRDRLADICDVATLVGILWGQNIGLGIRGQKDRRSLSFSLSSPVLEKIAQLVSRPGLPWTIWDVAADLEINKFRQAKIDSKTKY
jgi:hypothetical protein